MLSWWTGRCDSWGRKESDTTERLNWTELKWMITPSWLSGSWRSFLYSSSVYSCHLLLISSASVRSIPFLSFIEPILAWNIPLVSNFLEEISSLSYSVVCLYFFALIAEEGFLICSCYSLELCFQMLISFLFSFAFHFSSYPDTKSSPSNMRITSDSGVVQIDICHEVQSIHHISKT